MFKYQRNQSLLGGAFTTAELIFHAVVRDIRTQHTNAVMAIIINIMQMLLLAVFFYFLMSLMGRFGAPKIRGEFILYILSGIFLYLTHVKSVNSVMKVGSGNNPMTLHSPMSIMVMISAAALGAFYTQIVSILVILFFYSAVVSPLEIQYPGGAFGMLVLAWFTGCAVGLVFLALQPWFPRLITILGMVYRRMNMIFSGKMFVANALGGVMLTMFAWNPLFHIIDQCRGFVFRNYFPRNTNWEYALWVGIVLTMIGLLAEFYTRKQVSKSWDARR